ncbi:MULTISPECIES: hypothetical protein [unclassified Marinovum]
MARLKIRMDLCPRPERTEWQMRHEIDALRPDSGPFGADNLATTGDILDVALCIFQGADTPTFTLTVQAETEVAAQAELARLTLALLADFPISQIAWLSDAALLERSAFIAALAPAPAATTRPSRPARPTVAKTATRPPRRAAKVTPRHPVLSRQGQRPTAADMIRLQENSIRRQLCEPVPSAETQQLRRDQGRFDRERRIATAAISTSFALAVSTTVALADAMMSAPPL